MIHTSIRTLLVGATLLSTAVFLTCHPIDEEVNPATTSSSFGTSSARRTPEVALGAVAQAIIRSFAEATGSPSGPRLLCLGETHGRVADAALRIALLNVPEFHQTFDVILFEGASPLHQERIDEFVLERRSFSSSELAPIFQDAGRGVLWQLPMYERWLREVRRLNSNLPPLDRVRVLGAAVPIPWQRIVSPVDLTPWLDRTAHHVAQAEREVFDPGLTGLALFGRLHCEKAAGASEWFAAELEQRRPNSVWSTFALKGGAVGARARTRLALGATPMLLEITGVQLEKARAEDSFAEVHAVNGVLLGELANAAISYGDFPDSVRTVDEEALPSEFRRELMRRDQLRDRARAMANRER